ncbi:hypothetical protein E2P65_05065 [Candidatus Bathyarchaeota archaeon]|nr:hypothetical protein E2P65_05065 [Candidatus Bathyarchaeota archaeon]
MSEERKHASKDAQEVAEIFETLSTKIPEMLNGILGSLFSPEAASNMGKAVAEFRKSLIEGGIPEEEAMEMTEDYLGTLTNWSSVVRDSVRSGRHRNEE